MTIQPGQIWEDADPRSAGRTLRVVEVGVRRAVCEVVTDRRGAYQSSVGRKVAIRLERMQDGKRGYRLAAEPETR